MKALLLLSSLFVSFATHAWVDPFAAELNPYSMIKPHIKSCYRWMTKTEKSQWEKKGPFKGRIGSGVEGRWLGRDAETPKGVYCWHNPVGAMKGGAYENYGQYLARIDFVDDVVIYDRSRFTYVTDSLNPIPESMKKNLNTEVFYAHYKWKGFQEYIIKDTASIKGFTFNDHELKSEFETELNVFLETGLPLNEVHYFFTSSCPFKTIPEHGSYAHRSQNDKAYICYETRELGRKRQKQLNKYWEKSEEKWIANPHARAAF